MPIKLIIEGPAPYCTPQGMADAMAEQGRKVRELRNPHGQAQVVRVRQLGVVERLAEDGRLRKEQVQAALEVRAYWHRWTKGLFATGSTYTEKLDKGGGGFDPVTPAMQRYRAWAEWAEARKVKGELSMLTMVLDLVVDDRAPRTMRQAYKMSDRDVLRRVQEGLRHYAVLAGWVEDREAA